MPRPSHMDESTIQRIASEASKEAVSETLSALGFTPDNPNEIQKDLHYLRKVRIGSEFVSMRVKASAIAILVPTILYMLWQAIKEQMK